MSSYHMERDYLNVGYYTESFFAEKDIHYIAINDGIDSGKGDTEFTSFRNLFNNFLRPRYKAAPQGCRFSL